MRHRQPRAWAELVERYSKTGEEWFRVTPPDPMMDFASYLRHRFGAGCNLLALSVEVLPAWVVDQLPHGGLMPLDYRLP